MPSLFREFVSRLFPSKKAKSIRSCDRSKNRFILRPEILEDRTVPAFVTQNGFNLTIDLDTAGETVSLYSDSNSNIQFAVTGGTFVFSGGAPSPSNTFGFGPLSAAVNIFITDSAANTAVVFADSGNFTNPTRISATLDDPGAGTITFNGNTTFVGNGGVTASTSRNIVVSSGAVLSAADGDVSLAANQQGSPTSGGFAGVLVHGTVQTVNGDITLQGRGGDASGGQQFGVYVPGGTVQATGTGKVSVTGQGGTNAGVFNSGVALAFGGKIVGGTSGANSVIGTGGASDGSQNDGVFAQDATSVITTNGGNLAVTGNGGGTSGSSSNRGVILATGATISAGGTGSVTVQGTGGTGIGNNTGVALNNAGSVITSSGGAVSVTGAANSGNNAVEIDSGASLSSGANASVTITADSLVVDTSATPGTVSAGTGSLTIRQRTDGTQVNLGGSDAAGVLGLTITELGRITAGTLQIGNASTGAITISDDIAPANVGTLLLTTGVNVIDGNATGTDITVSKLGVTAVTGVATSANHLEIAVANLEATTGTVGVFLSNAGALTIGGVSGPLTGVRVTGGSGAVEIAASGTLTVNEGVQAPGNITLRATGGTSDLITGGGSVASTSSTAGTTRLEAGRYVLLGTAAGYGDARGQGLVLDAGRDIVVDAATYVQADGAAGLTANAGGDIKILSTLGAGSVLNSNGSGEVTLTTGVGGTFVLDQGSNGGVGANGQDITINSDNMTLTSGGIGTTATVTLTPVTAGHAINLGTNAAGTLGLTAAELNLVSAGTLVIGATTAGAITVSSDLSRSAATNVQLVSGGDIIQNSAAGSINTGGGTLSFSPGAAFSYKPNRSDTDATASTVSIASGGDLNINIAGADADSQYTRLTVAGAVNLNGVDLLLTGGYVPNTGEVFTIVSATSVTGTFNGYANNDVITLNGKTLRVNYTATSVTLTTIGAPTANAQSVTVGQDGADFPITLTGSDPNTSPVLTLSFIVTEQPAHGTLSGSGASLTYTPAAGYSGPDSFKFKTNNGFFDSTEVAVSITVAEAPAVGDLAPTAWTINQSGFTGSLAITGGTPGYTVTNQTGLPPGLTAVVNGAGTAIVFTGSPTSVGEFNGSVTLTDGNGAVVTKSFTITINPALALTNLTATAWTVGRTGFTGTLTLSGGTPARTITTQTGLPPGLTAVLSGNTISFTGVPTSTGSFKGSVTVTDGSGAQVTQTFTIVIKAAPKFSLAANALPKYTVGTPYNRAINVSGGTGALTLAVVSISAPLPTGMTLRVSGSTFILSGTPRVLRTPIRITLVATDSTGAQTTIVYTLTGQQSPVRRGL